MEPRIFLLLTLQCISCLGQAKNDGVQSTPAAPPSIQEQDRLAHAVNDFGYKLIMKMMRQKVNDNIIISPTGIAGLLAMTLLGSVGETYDEVAQALGFSQDILGNRKNHEQLGELLQQLETNDTQSQTLYADAIFVDEHTQLREVYRDYLKRVYNGEALSAQFGDTVKAKKLINEWVKGHTSGRIEDFLSDPLPATTKVVLLSALYFSGQWAKPFIPEHTKKMPFKTKASEIMVDLMLNVGEFNYTSSAENDLHIVAIPYNDSTTTMYVLKPRFPTKLSLTDLMASLDYGTINSLIKNMKKQDCVIRFPKMKLKTKVHLEDSLKALGLNAVFSPSDANFALMIDSNRTADKGEDDLISRINTGDVEARGLRDIVNSLPNPGVYVDSVLHDVKITINEYGTEAVAATSGVLARSAYLFYVDSPFYMFIRNERTNLVTFSAMIFNPLI